MTGGIRKELRPMLRLAAPLAMAELGWMAMGFVDTLMAGRLGAAAEENQSVFEFSSNKRGGCAAA